jgi:hypothetical protein
MRRILQRRSRVYLVYWRIRFVLGYGRVDIRKRKGGVERKNKRR